MSFEHVSLPCLNVVRSSEGRSLRAYKDSVGVWTIGYGITNYDKGIGFKVEAGVTITADQAESLLVVSLQNNYEPACRKVAGGILTTKQQYLDSGVDFHFNCGGITKATWPAAIARGDMGAAETSMLSWNKAGGRVLSGLTRRRKRDWAIIASGDYGPEGRSGPEIIDVSASGNELDTHKTAGPLTQLPGGLPTAPVPAPQPSANGTVVAPTPHPDHVPGLLQLGAVDPAVVEYKKDLRDLGYYKTGSMDETFDADFAAAVKDYQSHHPNLTADAKIGPATRAQIDREYAARHAVKTKAPTAGAIIATAGTAAKLVWGLSAETILVSCACVAAGVAIYFAVKYQDELKRNINKLLGRVVP